MARDKYGLTPRQRAWCDYYIETGNAAEAARRAGYSAKMAHSIGQENTGKPALKAYIAMRMQPTIEKRIATADDVLQFLSDVMAGKVKDQFGLDASLQDRIKAGQELMKRYAVADLRQQTTMARLDSLFVEFKAAITQEDPAQLPAQQPDAVQPEAAQQPEATAQGPEVAQEPQPQPEAGRDADSCMPS